MGETFYTVRATDSQAKRWMYDSDWYELEAGEAKILPAGPALQAQRFFTTIVDHAPHCAVELVPFDGKVTLHPAQAPELIDPDTGERFGSVIEMIEAAKKRGAAEAARKVAPLNMTEADLEALEASDLRELAANRGLTVAGNATKATLIKALLAGG